MDTPSSRSNEASLWSKKKRKKKGLKLNDLQIQGLGMKKEPQKRKAVYKRKEKSIGRALFNMDKQQEKLQKDESSGNAGNLENGTELGERWKLGEHAGKWEHWTGACLRRNLPSRFCQTVALKSCGC